MAIADLPRLTPSDFTYLGACRFPTGTANGITTPWSFVSDSNLAYNPTNNSVFAIGRQSSSPLTSYQPIAELALPTSFSTSPVRNDLPTMTYVQQPRSVVQFLTPPSQPAGHTWATQQWKLSGIAYDSTNSRLILGAYHYYTAMVDLESIAMAPSDIASWNSGNVTQPVKLYGTHQYTNASNVLVTKTLGGACFGMHVAKTPAEWVAELGKPWLCGGNGTSVVERTSIGPSAFGWDPDTLSTVEDRTTTLYQYQASDNERPEWRFSGFPDLPNGMADGNPSPIYNALTRAFGMLPIPATRTCIYTGQHTYGYIYYGQPNANVPGQVFTNGIQDDIRSGHGFHGVQQKAGWRKPTTPATYDSVGAVGNHGSYSRTWHFMDVSDWVGVKNATKSTTDVLPYARYDESTPIAETKKLGGGATVDSVNRRVFVVGLEDDTFGFAVQPLLHAWSYTIPSTGGPNISVHRPIITVA